VRSPTQVLETALELGFDLAGIAPLRPPRRAPEYLSWLEAGRHGQMQYLADWKPRILDPQADFGRPGSLLVVGFAHSRPAFELADGTRVARYAAGRDYHNVVGKRLRRLARRLRERGLVREFRKVVDAGPLMERSHAAEAGIGFESKAANLLHPRFGPWYFLGELVLDVEYEPTPVPPAGSCGTCRACLDACPTQAIVAPGEVDARRCISYQTIELAGPQDPGLRGQHGPWAFGCDVCSEVCPWERRAPDLAARLGTHPVLETTTAADWVERPAEVFAALGGSPLQRAGAEGLARNAATALGNRPTERGRAVLLQALEGSPSPVLREAAAGALALGHGTEAPVRSALERAAGRDPEEKAALLAWRARCG